MKGVLLIRASERPRRTPLSQSQKNWPGSRLPDSLTAIVRLRSGTSCLTGDFSFLFLSFEPRPLRRGSIISFIPGLLSLPTKSRLAETLPLLRIFLTEHPPVDGAD